MEFLGSLGQIANALVLKKAKSLMMIWMFKMYNLEKLEEVHRDY